MITIPDLNMEVYRKAEQDIKEYTELYNQQRVDPSYDTQHIDDFNKSLRSALVMLFGYRRYICRKLCKLKEGQEVSVVLNNILVCHTTFSHAYADMNTGKIYLCTNASLRNGYSHTDEAYKLVY